MTEKIEEYLENGEETTLEMLEKALRKAIKDENYELASSIRDELNRRKNSEERKK